MFILLMTSIKKHKLLCSGGLAYPMAIGPLMELTPMSNKNAIKNKHRHPF